MATNGHRGRKLGRTSPLNFGAVSRPRRPIGRTPSDPSPAVDDSQQTLSVRPYPSGRIRTTALAGLTTGYPYPNRAKLVFLRPACRTPRFAPTPTAHRPVTLAPAQIAAEAARQTPSRLWISRLTKYAPRTRPGGGSGLAGQDGAGRRGWSASEALQRRSRCGLVRRSWKGFRVGGWC